MSGQAERGPGAAVRERQGLRQRAFHANGRRLAGDIFQLHLVGDNVAANELLDLFAEVGLGIDQEVVREREQVKVRLDAALRV